MTKKSNASSTHPRTPADAASLHPDAAASLLVTSAVDCFSIPHMTLSEIARTGVASALDAVFQTAHPQRLHFTAIVRLERGRAGRRLYVEQVSAFDVLQDEGRARVLRSGYDLDMTEFHVFHVAQIEAL